MFNAIKTISIITSLMVLSGAARPPMPQQPDQEKKDIAEIGEKAPLFDLKDQQGNAHALTDFEGKVVVLEWFNEKCPYCKGVWDSGLVPKLINDLKKSETDVVYLAINSTANQPEEKVLKSGAEFLEEMETNIPMLMDYNGKVGRAYGARTTPHMFVIDAEGVLVYSGALSDDKHIEEGADAQTHVMRVMTQLENGEEISPSYVQPWGCSVKYARDGKRNRPGRGTRDPR